MKNTLLIQSASPAEEKGPYRFFVTHDVHAKSAFASRLPYPDLLARVAAFKDEIDVLLKSWDTIGAQAAQHLSDLVKRGGSDVADGLLSDEAKNVICNFMDRDTVLALNDEISAGLPWELLTVPTLPERQTVAEWMLVTRVCQQVPTNPLSERRVARRQCAAWTTKGLQVSKRYETWLQRYGFKTISNRREVLSHIADSKGIAVVAQSTLARSAKSVTAGERHKHGLKLDNGSEVYSYVDIVGTPMPMESIVFLFSCRTSGGPFAQEIVRASRATVIASEFELPADACSRLACKVAGWLRGLDSARDISQVWMEEFQRLSPLASLFTMYGNWRGRIGP
jgi:hypothetical protein